MMSGTTIEQRLRLVRQVRSRYQEDQCDLSDRERILYGRASTAPERTEYGYGAGDPYGAAEAPAETEVSSFRLRLFLAMFLVMAVVVMDRNDMAVAGITPEKVYEVISEDYGDIIETWVETLADGGNTVVRMP